MVAKQYDVFLINLDPTIGHEIRKSRPCLILSPNEMNDSIATLIVAPMTTRGKDYPSRVSLTFQGKQGWIVLDQIRTIDRSRCVRKLGRIPAPVVTKVKQVIREMLVD